MSWFFTISNVSLYFALIANFNSLVFSLICFSVPDWLQYNSNGYPVKLGLWEICYSPISYFSKSSCYSWSNYQLETPGSIMCFPYHIFDQISQIYF